MMTGRGMKDEEKADLLVAGVLVFCAIFLIQVFYVRDVSADPFSRGSISVSVAAGSAHALDDDYLIIGVGTGYYLRDGLELGLDFDAWVGGDHDIYSISPRVNYVLRNQTKLKPYGGLFYRHTYIEDLDDVDALGARGGINVMTGRNSYLGVGAVYERYLDCKSTIYSSCDDLYPEVVLSVAF